MDGNWNEPSPGIEPPGYQECNILCKATSEPNNNTSSLFENSLSTQNTPLIFGTQTQAPSNPTQTDNLFGNSSNNQPNSLFGATNQSAAPQTNSLFGNLSSNDTSQAGTQSSNLFGNLSNNNNTGTSHPGAQPTNLFGSLTNDNTPQPGIQTTNLFGSLSNNNSNNTTQPGQSSNLFGSLSNTNNNNSTTQPGQSSYLFESLSNNNNSNTTQSATQSNNLFGSLSNNNLSTTGFGGQSTTTPANNYLYKSSLNQSTSLTTNNTLSTLRSSTAQLARRPITLSELLIQDWIIKIHASWKVSVEIVTLKCGHMSNATQIQTRLVEIQIRLTQSSNLFGNLSNNNNSTNSSQPGTQPTNLFGSLTNNNTPQPGTQTTNLFGSLSNNTSNNTTQPGTQPTNLFGSLTNNNTPQPGTQNTNLFGSLSNNNSNNTTQPGQSSNLFGSLSNTNNNNSTTQPGQSSYLFGSLSNNNSSNTAQSATQSNNLFGSLSNNNNNTNNLSTTGFGGQSMTTPANNYLYNSINNSSLNQSTSLTTNNALSTLRSSTAQLARRPITLSELSIQDQIIKIHASWKVSDPQCQFQFFFYNVVPPEQVHLYGRPNQLAPDDPRWQRAKRNNPDPSRLVPTLAIGFEDLTKRVTVQQKQAQVHLSKLGSTLDQFGGKSKISELWSTLHQIKNFGGFFVSNNSNSQAAIHSSHHSNNGSGSTNQLNNWSSHSGFVGVGSGDGGGGKWSVTDDREIKKVLEILLNQQKGIDHLILLLRKCRADVILMRQAFNLESNLKSIEW
ncbi:hypothetical protein PSHT_12396 [Puccinia striiformis]|uniref:Nucleoporin Nup54 alpha-helical domain-containing protein n=1 Tax=Puccinia striiformis TaxID=27350 RepID=A0A2S4UWS5_9BASI|nr:hypothetical protein PSHT_12396 [Puccinia striiformis]